jgi:transglutaminase-like putative cysteine protease
MPTLTVRHATTYRYRNPVAFGEHRMMFRPREDADLGILDWSLRITPEPTSLRAVHDAFGNHVGIARFSGLARELRFVSTFTVELAAANFSGAEIDAEARRHPFAYADDEAPDLACFMERRERESGSDVDAWARRFVPPEGTVGTFELLDSLNRGIRDEFQYRRRDAKGVQPASETLRLGHGSCRDLAMLMIEACRSLGLAARFASGYLAVPLEYPADASSDSPRGSTHAWAQVYLPGAGWVDFDPTSGKMGKGELITVAIVRDPRHAIPLHGTYIGAPSDPIGMEVEVDVRRGARLAALRPTPRRAVASRLRA